MRLQYHNELLWIISTSCWTTFLSPCKHYSALRMTNLRLHRMVHNQWWPGHMVLPCKVGWIHVLKASNKSYCFWHYHSPHRTPILDSTKLLDIHILRLFLYFLTLFNFFWPLSLCFEWLPWTSTPIADKVKTIMEEPKQRLERQICGGWVQPGK